MGSPRFQDYDSEEGLGTLCLLYDDEGVLLGSVWQSCDGWWHWEDSDGAQLGPPERTRRAAKARLRTAVVVA